MGFFDIFKKKKKVEEKQSIEQNVSVEPDPQMFHGVYNLISEHLPENWDKLAVYYATSGSMFELKYYVDSGKGYVDCNNLKEYDENNFYKLTIDVHSFIKQIRSNLPENKRWSVFTMFISSSGKFETNFSYDDISKSYIEYRNNWEKENIKNK